VYHEQNLTLTDGCMLRSVTRLPDCVRLQGDGTARLLNGTNLPRGIQVEGITLAGGRQPGTGLDGMGGAVLLTDTPAGFRSCIFTDNLARFGGAGVSSSGDSLVLEACVLDRNSAESQCGAWLCTSAIFRLEGCLVTDNSGSNLFNRAPEIVCSDLFGNPAGDWSGAWADQVGERGNLCADPLYCDVPAGDFRLLPDSPCLPPASACGAMGAFPTSCLTDLPPTQQPLDFAVASWPNPFNPVARVQVQLPVSARVELRLFNVAGQLVWEDAADRLAAGRHEWRLDGSAWSSGLYLLDVLAGDQRAVRKLTLLK
jgi:hypothetical protein